MTTPFEELLELPVREKLAHFLRSEKIYHVISAHQFDRATLELLCRTATLLRKIARANEGAEWMRTLLSTKSAMLYFTQPSTRTYLSFVRACQYLGMGYAEVRDPRISSAMKGESDIDGVRTFSSYFDLIVMRHVESGFAERTAHMMNAIERGIPIISAGAGMDEHPTQALLDIYTLVRSFERRRRGIEGIHIAFVGDLKRGRTVRSLVTLLTRYPEVKLTFVSPESLRIREDVSQMLARERVDYSETDTLASVLTEVDAIYMTRIQDEYDDAADKRNPVDYSPFHLTLSDVERMKPSAVVMHPFPRRAELDPAIDANPRAMYWRQERNGMWMRAALIAHLFNVEGRVLDYYARHHNY
jgi:aspartate carbamoyltransferase catalytic subunit